MRTLNKKDWIILGVLTVAAALLRFVNLAHPAEIVFDETYFANFAHNYLTNTDFFDAEPPLAKFIIAAGEQLFGFNSFGWRFMPALFGTAVIPLMYLLVKRLFGGVLMPTLAAVLTLFDGLLLVESRTAVIDIFVVFFNLLTYLCFFLSLQARSHRRGLVWLAATGVSLGLALSVKWITLAFIGPAIGVLVVLTFSNIPWLRKLFKVPDRAALFKAIGATRTKLPNVMWYVGLLGVLPAVLYVAIFSIHVPFDSTGGSLVEIHKQIFNYHHNLNATHPYGSAWYTWPLDIRPVAYYFQGGERWSAIIALGNPLLFWSGVVALVYGAVQFARTRSLALGILLLAFLAHFAPWALIDRVLFMYHYLGGLPFTIIALAYALTQNWHWKPKDGSVQILSWAVLLATGGVLGGLIARSALGGAESLVTFAVGAALVMLPLAYFVVARVGQLTWGMKQTIVAVGLIVLAFVYFYPIWTGLPLDPKDYYRHMWLKSWV